jgi:hypothetical protein
MFEIVLKVLSYADDLALVADDRAILQVVLNLVVQKAAQLGLHFNPPKCATLTQVEGRPAVVAPLYIGENAIRELMESESEEYLGTPIGSRLCFRLPHSLPSLLSSVADSLLSPWQKLEVFRSFLMPSLSHHFASGRVLKKDLYELDLKCREFLAVVANVPGNAIIDFFYADRRAGGLGAPKLSVEADIWTIARAVQLLSSPDPIVRAVSFGQLTQNIVLALKPDLPNPLPFSEYLSGGTQRGFHGRRDMFDVRFSNQGDNMWGRARKAAMHLNGLAAKHGLPPIRVEIDVPGAIQTESADDVSLLLGGLTPNLVRDRSVESTTTTGNGTLPLPATGATIYTIMVVAPFPRVKGQQASDGDDTSEELISAKPCKAVRGLRTATRSWFTNTWTKAPHQGAVANALLLDNYNDTAASISVRSRMTFEDWRYVFRARLGLLPLRGLPGSTIDVKGCRRCDVCSLETTAHVLNSCPSNRGLFIKRHDAVLGALVSVLQRSGHRPTVNRQTDDNLRPDIFIEADPPIIIEVSVPFDRVANLEAAYKLKISKYNHIGRVLPLIVGSLGSWWPPNNDIPTSLDIRSRTWSSFRRSARLLAIQGSTATLETLSE